MELLPQAKLQNEKLVENRDWEYVSSSALKVLVLGLCLVDNNTSLFACNCSARAQNVICIYTKDMVAF